MTSQLTIIGLGPGDPAMLTREAWQIIQSAEHIFLRTRQHPAIEHLPELLNAEDFDSLYDTLNSFEAVYSAIEDKIIEQMKSDNKIVYAVPGDPSVGESAVHGLRNRCSQNGFELRIVAGVSFIEVTLDALGLDGLDSLLIVDALDLAAQYYPSISPDRGALVGQLYSRAVAADVKLTLMTQYPDDHPVALVNSAGSSDQLVHRTELYKIDQVEWVGPRTSLYVPALDKESAFESLQNTIAHLRAPEGCPWDREQTHVSLRSHLLEETYETLLAIDTHDAVALQEELGDLLIQVLMHTQIAAEDGSFNAADVVAGVQSKLIRRHPHVFGDLKVHGSDEVLENWETLKRKEREQKGELASVLDGVARSLPSLAEAQELQTRAARLGFDWPEVDGTLDKIQEETLELSQASSDMELEAEFGDLLMALVNFGRWKGIDAESALRISNQKFRSRFSAIEGEAEKSNKPLNQWSLEEMDAVWEKSKRAE